MKVGDLVRFDGSSAWSTKGKKLSDCGLILEIDDDIADGSEVMVECFWFDGKISWARSWRLKVVCPAIGGVCGIRYFSEIPSRWRSRNCYRDRVEWNV